MRVPIRSLGTLVLAAGVATCADAPTASRARPAKANGGRSVVSAQPVFTKAAAAVYAQRETFASATFDHVRIVLTRPGTNPPEVIADTTIVFNPSSPPQSVDLDVGGASPGDSFTAAADYTNNGQVVYHGQATVQSYAPGSPPPSGGEIAVAYIGPGANVTRVAVSPKTATIIAPGSATFSAAGFDATNAPVANNPVSWSVSDPTVASITAAGVLTATGKRGVVTVTATAIAGASDGATATVTLPPSAIALVSGAGQTGKAGNALGQPGVVKVTATDGVGVQGVTVNFAAPSGGSVGATSVTTDQSGNASTSLTLGGALGLQSFAAAAGNFSVSISATATPGDPASVTVVSGGSQQDTVKAALAAFVVKVADRFGNGVPGVTVTWSRTGGSGNLSGSTSTTGPDGSASIGYTLGATPGSETVTASVGGVSGGATFTAQATAGVPSAIAVVSGGAQTGRAQQPLAAPFVVTVSDASGNPVNAASVRWSATNGVITATTTTGTTGQTSATMTLGQTLGAASATASIGSGANVKSVSFAATVQAGVVAQLAYRTGPPATVVASAVLAPPIVVELRDAAGNLTAASNPVTIALGTNPGQATLSGTLTVNAAAGLATFSDLAVSAQGNGYTLVVSSAGVPNLASPTFNVSPAGSVPSGTWAGTASTDWFAAGNWGGGLVPTTTTNVVIPANAPNMPVLTANATVANLSVAPGASLGLGTFTLTALGNVDGGTGPGIGGTGTLAMTSTGKTFRGVVSNLSVGAAVTQSGAGVVTGNASITPGGSLTVNQQFTVNGALSASGASAAALATIVIANGAQVSAASLSTSGASGVYSQTGGSVLVTGAASFAGNASTTINAGTLVVSGDFTQVSGVSTASFAPSGTHTVVLNGSGTQNLNFADPNSSHFQNLQIVGTGTVNLVTTGGALTVAGLLTSPQGVSTVHSSGLAISSAGFDIDGLVFDNTRFVSTGGTIGQFDNVTFQNYSATVTPLTITHPGAATPFTFNNTQFLVTPTSGRYLNVTDSSPTDGQQLVITLLNSTPADGSAQTSTAGGAQVNWQTTGATIAWTNAAGGRWAVATNWSLGRVPGLGDSVVIALSGTYTVTLDVAASVKSITIGAAAGAQTLTVSGVSLTLSNVLTTLANGVFNPSSATLAASGNIVNQGTTRLVNSVINTPFTNRGTVIVGGSTTMNSILTTVQGSMLRMQGSNSVGNAFLTTANGFTNNAAIELTTIDQGFSAGITVTAGTLVNAAGATITSLPGTGGARSLNVQLDNQGTLTVQQPLTMGRASSVISNSSIIDLSQGDLAVSQFSTAPISFTNTGTITIGAGHTLSVTGGVFNYNTGGSITGAGTWSLQGVTANLGIDFTNGTTTLLLSNSTVNGPGKLTNAATKTLVFTNSTVTGAVDNQGLLLVGGSDAINGALTTSQGSMLRMQGSNSVGNAFLTTANGFTNNGAIELTTIDQGFSTGLTVTNGTLVNAVGATITSLPGTQGGGRTLAAQLDNQGTLSVQQALTINRASSVHSNSGTIDLTQADLALSQFSTAPISFTNTGTITIGAGRTFNVSGGVFNYNTGGSISGAGTWNLQSVTVNLGIDFTNGTTTLVLGNSTVNGPGKLVNALGKTLNFVNGNVGANGVLDNQGLLLVGGSSVITGTLTTTSTSVIRMQGSNSVGNGFLTTANGFTNNGAIELTTIDQAFSTGLTVTNGTLVNASGATITSLPGAGGARTLTVQLDNQGKLTVQQPLTINRASSVHSNSGTIDLSQGDLTLSQFSTAPISFTNTGTVTVGSGHTFTVSGGVFNSSPGGTVTGAGTWSLQSVTANLSVDVTNATTALVLSNTTVNGPNKLTNAPTKTLVFTNSTSNAALDNQGLLLVGGSSAINGTLTTTSTSLIRMQGSNAVGNAFLTVANSFTNSGAIEQTTIDQAFSTGLTVTNGTLVNAVGATITMLPGVGGARTMTVQLDNQGTLTVQQALTMNRASSVHSNSGTIDLSLGDLSVSQFSTAPISFTNSGTITIGNGHAFTLSGGVFNYNAGSIAGAGTLSLQSVTAANFNVPFTNATTTLLMNSTTITGTVTNAATKTLAFVNSTVGAGGTLINQGTLQVGGSSIINGQLTTSAPPSLLLLQGSNAVGNAFLTVNTGTGFVNNGLVTMTTIDQGFSVGLTVTSGTMTNAAGATITTLPGANGSRSLAAALDNQGSVVVQQPLTLGRANSVITNSGSIDASASDVAVNQSGSPASFTNTGAITVGAGHTFTVSAGTFTQQSGPLSGAGTLVLTGVSAATFNTAVTVAGLSLTNTTATFTTSLSTGTTSIGTNGSTINGAITLTNVQGQSFQLLNTTIGSGVTFANQGTLLVGGSNTINGPLTTTNTSDIQLTGSNAVGNAFLTVNTPAVGFTNNGTIELTTQNQPFTVGLTVTNGTLTNANGATITSLVGNAGGRNLSAALDNQGSLIVQQPLTMGRANSVITNSGTIDLSAGDLTMNQSGTASVTNTGAITVGASHTFTVSAGTFTQQSGTLSGAGTLVLTGVPSATFSTAVTTAGLSLTNTTAAFSTSFSTGTVAFATNGSTINGTGAITLTNPQGQSLTLLNSAVGTNVTLANQGTLIVGGSSTINGPLTTTTTSDMQLTGNNALGNSFLTVNSASGFINNGTIELSTVSQPFSVSLTVTNGTLTNAVGAAITSQPGALGSRTIAAAIDNQGAINVQQPVTLNRANSTYTNSGTINAAANVTLQMGAGSSFTNTGAITLASGTTWTATGGTFTHQSGTLGGAGTLALGAVTGTLNGGFTPGALSVFSGSTVTLGTSLSTATTALSTNNATFNGTATITNPVGVSTTLATAAFAAGIGVQNQGTLVMMGTSSFSGALTNSAGATLRVQGDASAGNANLAIADASQVTSNGAIEMTSAGGAFTSTITINANTLTSNGTLTTFVGAGGTRQINVVGAGGAFSNAGTVNIASGGVGTLTIGGANSRFINFGTVNFKLNGTAAGQFDQMVITGSAQFALVGNLRGTLAVSLGTGFTPTTGTTFPVFTYASETGGFQTLAPLGWSTLIQGTSLSAIAP